MADELLDLVDKNDAVIGTVWKSEAHGNPNLVHREVRIFIFDFVGNVLLQQRSLTKKNGPGWWVESSAGHVGSGEDPEKAAERELFEELGIKMKLVFYKKVFDVHNEVNENQESRYTYVYYAVVGEYPKLILQESEVSDAKWIPVQGLSDFAKHNKYSLTDMSHKTIVEIYNKKII